MRKEAHLFKAFSDPIRLRILALLAKGDLCVADLVAALELPQSTVSRHLATLRSSGMVRDQRQGVYVRYGLAAHGNTLERDLAFLVEKRISSVEEALQDADRLRAHQRR